MPDVRNYMGSYLKAEDFREPEILTVRYVQEETIEGEDTGKLVMHFLDKQKALVLNKINCRLLATQVFGTPSNPAWDTNEWHGRKVELFNDPTVTFRDHQGGIRVRAPAPERGEPRREPGMY